MSSHGESDGAGKSPLPNVAGRPKMPPPPDSATFIHTPKDFMQEPITVYYANSTAPSYAAVREFLESRSLPFTAVDLTEDEQARAAVAQWTDDRTDIESLVRIGDKIRALLVNSPVPALARLLADADAGALDRPITVYSADWCPDCRRLEGYLTQGGVAFSKVNIEEVEGAPERIIRWSGGRRVVPTVRLGDDILLFNPGTQVMGRMLGI